MKSEAQLKAEIERLQRSVEEQARELDSKNRELKIEAALERVRARTMAMHQSDELLDTAKILFHQLQELGIGLHVCGFGIPDKDSPVGIQYLSIDGTEFPEPVPIRFDVDPYLMKAYEDWKQGKTQLIFDIQGEELENHLARNADQFKDLGSADILANQAAKYSKGQAQQPQRLVVHHAFFKHGILFLSNDRPIDNIEILVRFAKVFEQTYTRFLDLQKAEEQAREAQIEAALERVRSRTMAMQKSNELSQVVAVIYEEINRLGFTDWGCSIIICDIQESVMRYWYAETNMPHLEDFCNVPLTNKIVKKTWDLWQSGIPQFDINLLGKEKEDYTSFMLNNTDYNQILPEEVKKGWLKPKDLYLSYFTLKFGLLEFVDIKPLNRENYSAYERFTKVFEQTYTRFLDLQKAEAQAKEAQIEVALERVRARAMAMHKSEELGEAAELLYEELKKLGLSNFINCGYVEIDKENNCQYGWMTNSEGKSMEKFNLPLVGEPILQMRYDSWLRKEPVFCQTVGGDELKKHLAFVNPQLGSEEVIEHVKNFFHDPTIFYSGNFAHGYLSYITGNHLTPDEEALLARFTKVFEMRYKRFLDLQKAEAQAREAEIQLALERVRARTMAMQKSDELKEVVAEVFEKLLELGFGLESGAAIIHVFSKDSKDHIEWVADPSQVFPRSLKMPFFENPLRSDVFNAWQSGIEYYSKEYSREIKDDFFAYTFEHTDYKLIANPIKEVIRKTEKYSYTIAFGGNTAIGIPDTTGRLFTAQEEEILSRFAKVFEQPYTRFLDLQKAEAQAREAQIEVALEKVRSQSLAMHSTSEIQLVANEVSKQLRGLGLELDAFVMVGTIHIEEGYDVWLGGADATKPLWIPFNDDTQIQREYNEVLKKRPPLFAKTYTGQIKKEYIDKLLTDGEFAEELKNKMINSSAFSTALAHTKNSGIQIIRYTPEPYTEAENDILKRFAKVFEQAYTRFLDLQKAEAQAREAQIEVALERVRARAMAMHSSNELIEVANVMHEQMTLLQQSQLEAFVIHLYPEKGDQFEAWISQKTPGKENRGLTTTLTLSKKETKFAQQFFKLYLSEPKEYLIHAHGEMLGEWNRMVISRIKGLKKAWGKNIPTSQYWFFSDFSGGSFLLVSRDEPNEESKELTRRASSVFDLAYTRFLDLKKAEAQAREAQIEVSLERVRSRSMAMHKSEELNDVATVLFQQIRHLGGNLWTCGIVLCQKDSEVDQFMVALENDMAPTIDIPNTKDPATKNMYHYWKKGADYYVEEAGGKDLKKHYDYLETLPTMKPVIDNLKASGISLPTWQQWHAAYFTHGYLMIITVEPYPQEEVFKRFAKVFEQAYTRFLDLQKAEAQARESEIQLALERVRARTMAMQNSSELAETASVLFQQLFSLGIKPGACAFSILNEQDQTGEVWITSDGNVNNRSYIHPYHTDPAQERIFEAWKSGKTYHLDDLENEELFNHIQFLSKHMPIFDMLDSAGDAQPKRIVIHAIYFLQGFIGLTYDSPQIDHLPTLIRFAKVFEQTYTRFLDLKKAEAQAREAQIEAALERVRARTMAMHKSDELTDTASQIYVELESLGIKPLAFGFNIWISEKPLAEAWSCAGSPDIMWKMNVPHNVDPSLKKIYKGKNSGADLFSGTVKGKALKKHFEYMKTIMSQGGLPDDSSDILFQLPDIMYMNAAYFKQGYLLLTALVKNEEAKSILVKFAKVFEQTYTRFLDLKKAEAQAREAQIEAALERVRARMMAMHKTSELHEVLGTIFTQLQLLEVYVPGSALIIYNEDLSAEHWMTGFSGDYPESYKIPYVNHPYFTDLLKAWQEGVQFAEFYFEGDLKIEYAKWCLEYSDFKRMPPEFKNEMLKPDRMVISDAFNKYGMIEVLGNEPMSKEASGVLSRFSKVFEQTYTRFLDLKKAEAQAREARIEAALEKVRSSSLAMHSPKDLEQVVIGIVQRLQELGVILDANGITLCTYFQDSKNVLHWIASPDFSFVGSYLLPYFEHPIFRDAWESRESGADYFSKSYAVEDKNSFFEYAFEHSDYSYFPEEFKQWIFQNDKHILSFAWQKNSAILIPSNTGIVPNDAEKAILIRFSKVFEQAYVRFMDLQKAEAREKEAIKQSSLDRVRAEIASMRTTQDLERITPLLWKELTALGVPFFRCGIFIIKEEEKMVHAYLSTPDGKSLGALHIGFDEKEVDLIGPSIENWRKQSAYSEEWNQKRFVKNMKRFVELGLIVNTTEYQAGEKPPEKLVLNLVPFKQGMLYVGNSESLIPEHIALMQDLANVFAIAYSRYEDFIELELAKSKVESTLSDLKSTQAQLIQSEKMASLGELTAGIAHEIQNPLNFVNNFSEVSAELIDEIQDIRFKTQDGKPESEEDEILEDIKQNLEKITLHGKRADAIVKGMLEHSKRGSGQKEPTNLNVLADEFLRLSYQSFLAKEPGFKCELKTNLDSDLPQVSVIPQDIGKVLLNLMNNAFYAINEKTKSGKTDFDYKPIVTVSSSYSPLAGGQGGFVELSVQDNGGGIPEQVRDKIFQPFFTTKPTGSGTGLGLSLSYDIVKAHGGELKVESKEGKGSKFIFSLPNQTTV